MAEEYNPELQGWVKVDKSYFEGMEIYYSLPDNSEYYIPAIMPYALTYNFKQTLTLYINGKNQTYVYNETASLDFGQHTQFKVIQSSTVYSFTSGQYVDFANDDLRLEFGAQVEFENSNDMEWIELPFDKLTGGYCVADGTYGFFPLSVFTYNKTHNKFSGVVNNLTNNAGGEVSGKITSVVITLKATDTNYYGTDIIDTIYNGFEANPVRREIGLLEKISGGISSVFTAIKNLPNIIVDGFKSLLNTLFVPKDTFMSDTIQPMIDKMEDNLGVIAFPVKMATDVVSLVQNNNPEPKLTFDGFKLPVIEHDGYLIPPFTVNLNDYTKNLPWFVQFRDISAGILCLSMLLIAVNRLWHNLGVDKGGVAD